jgi:Tol biopolymer transport system component
VWSPDGHKLAAVLTDSGHTQRIAVISVATKSVVTLKATGWNFPEVGGFSPDGKYLLYSLDHTPPALDGGVFAIAVDGSSQHTLVQTPNKDHSPMWTPDGRGIVFISDRSGKPALWHESIRDGNAHGEPRLLRTDIGDVNMGFARDGLYFYATRNNRSDAYIATVNPDTLDVLSPATRLTERFIGSSGAPAFSPDGTRVAFMANAPTLSLVIRSLADGSERILPTRFPLGQRFGPQWLPNGRDVLVGETDFSKGLANLRRIDVETGAETPFFTTAYGGLYGKVKFSSDGRWMFYSFRTGGDLLHLMRRDLATNQETDLYHVTSDGLGLFGLSLSPDGKRLAFTLNVPSGANGEGPRALQVISADGGTPKEVMRGGFGCPATSSGTWSGSGRYLLVICDDDPHRPLWVVPSEGGPARNLDIVLDGIGAPALSPDGRTIAFTATKREHEIWTVANLLSSVQ